MTPDWNALGDGQFRSEVRSFFEQNYPPALRYPTRRLRWAEIKEWYFTLSRKGWLAPLWPIEHGGMNLPSSKLLILLEEQERWGVARVPDVGLNLVGPLLIEHGSDAQKADYLPKILAGQHIWCQACSESHYGSNDVPGGASAVLRKSEFVVNGIKTWATSALDATHILLLVRADLEDRPDGAVIFLLIDRASPGVVIRPIRDLAGQEEFGEVTFDHVRVPLQNAVGDIHEGWGVADSVLRLEHLALGHPQPSRHALRRLRSIARQRGLLDDPVFLDKLTALQLDVADVATLYARLACRVTRGDALGSEVAVLKVWATETYSRLANLIVEAAGSAGAMVGRIDFGREFVDVLPTFYQARLASICCGGNELQRSLIARDVLGLPS